MKSRFIVGKQQNDWQFCVLFEGTSNKYTKCFAHGHNYWGKYTRTKDLYFESAGYLYQVNNAGFSFTFGGNKNFRLL